MSKNAFDRSSELEQKLIIGGTSYSVIELMDTILTDEQKRLVIECVNESYTQLDQDKIRDIFLAKLRSLT